MEKEIIDKLVLKRVMEVVVFFEKVMKDVMEEVIDIVDVIEVIEKVVKEVMQEVE